MTRYEEQMYHDIHNIAESLTTLTKQHEQHRLISRNNKTIDNKSRLTLSLEALQIVGTNVVVDIYDDRIVITKGAE